MMKKSKVIILRFFGLFALLVSSLLVTSCKSDVPPAHKLLRDQVSIEIIGIENGVLIVQCVLPIESYIESDEQYEAPNARFIIDRKWFFDRKTWYGKGQFLNGICERAAIIKANEITELICIFRIDEWPTEKLPQDVKLDTFLFNMVSVRQGK